MPGIRESVYLGGYTISRGPASITERRDYAKTEQRLRDGTLASHYLWPTDGDPDLLLKMAWTLTWPVNVPKDCIWKQKLTSLKTTTQLVKL
jgi:hypothetical protein